MAGRPTKYRKAFHPKDYLRLCKEGKTIAQVCAEWEISRDTLNKWGKDKTKKEFTDAIKKGKEAREAWFVNFGMNIAAGQMKGSNVVAYIWLTKNCLGWKDKIENTHIDQDMDFDFGDDDES